MVIKAKNLLYVSIYLYLVSVFCCSTGTGIDHYFSLAAFGLLIGAFIIYCLTAPITNIRLTNFFIFSCLFWIFNLFSYTWSSYKSSFFESNIINDAIQILPLILIITNITKNKESIQALMKIFLSAVFTMIFVIIARTPISDYTNGIRIGTVTGLWVNELGRYYVFALVFLFYFFKESKKRIYKISCILLMLIIMVFMLLTQSKGPIINILLFVFISAVLLSKNWEKALKNLALVVVLCLLVVIILINNAYFNENVLSRFTELFNFFSDADELGSTATRFKLMGFGFNLFLESPIFGQGYNAVHGYTASIGFMISTYSHCNYVEILSSTGLIGLVLYLYPILQLFKLYPSRNKDPLIKMCLALTVLILITDIYSISYSQIGNVFVLCLCSGLLSQNKVKNKVDYKINQVKQLV